MPPSSFGLLRRTVVYALTFPAVVLATWAGVLLNGGADTVPLSLTPLTLVVALAAWLGGRGPGGLALGQSAIAADFLIVRPGTLLQFDTPLQAAAFGLYVAGWLGFCLLADRVFRSLHRDRDLRETAERAAAQADRVAQLTAALGQARTTRSAIEAALQEPMFALQADAGVLLLISGDHGTADVARAVGYPRQGRPPAVRLTSKSPVADAVGRGAPIILESREAWFGAYPDDPILARGLFEATIVVPMLVGSRVVAVVRLEFTRPRPIDADDRHYLQELATRGAQALDRTRELEFAERARSEAEALRSQSDRELIERKGIESALRASEARYRALAARTSRLHALAGALSEAVTVEAVARAVIDHGRIVAGATVGEVMLLINDGKAFERISPDGDGEHSDDRTEVPADPGLCATVAVMSGQAIFIRSFDEWQERFPQSASFAADGGYESSATMPLLVEGAAIGVVAFHFTAPVNFDEDYRTLLMSVAGHCAQALERARLYESTQRARADAEDANRSKDEFVSIVSHELRTPLSAIVGWATMLQRGALDAEKSTRAMQSICENANRQAKLIDELLDFSRVTSGRAALHMEQVEIRDVIRGVVESMIPTSSARGVALELSSVPPVQVVGDIRRLEQVFFNLVDNALKFTPKQGRVSIDARIADGRVEIEVSDDGAGIDPEFLPFVFDRFRQGDSTTSRNHGGLGLGMSIARQLVQAHQGTITAASGGVNRGSTFTVSLPIAAPKASAAGPDDKPGAPAPRLAGIRVLVVDDDEDAREIMAHALESYGARVQVAANAHDALDILEHADVDALLSDISMPEEDGYSLIRKVRASKVGRVASVPAAAVTALTRSEHRDKVIAAGFHLHVPKPFVPAQLATVVETLTQKADGSRLLM
jgi:signal transduction histidine kinase